MMLKPTASVTGELRPVRQARRCNFKKGEYKSQIYTDDKIVELLAIRRLQIFNRQAEDLAADPLIPRRGRGPDSFLGFDSEFVMVEGGRLVLCLALHLLGEFGWISQVYYAKSQKPKLVDCLVDLVTEAVRRNVILEWPRRLIVCAHFLRTDLASCRDFPAIKHQVDSASGSIATVHRDARFEVELRRRDLVRLEAATRQTHRSVHGQIGRMQALTVRFVDTAALCAPGTRLEDMGVAIGLPKLSLPPEHSIERMDRLLHEDPRAFENYALRDAEIAAVYLKKVSAFSSEQLGLKKLPVTASSMAMQYFMKRCLPAEGLCFDAVFGLRSEKVSDWDSQRGRPRSVTKKVPLVKWGAVETFVRQTYHGGRNESFYVGPTPEGDFVDRDLMSAYTAALVDIREPDYGAIREVRSLEEVRDDGMYFLCVQFEFPPDTRYPSLPVDAGIRGLIYPLQGESYCTEPELAVALSQGCHVRLVHGVAIPWKPNGRRPFLAFTRFFRERRLEARAEGRRLDEQLLKLCGNGLYGKIAQAILPKKSFDPRSGGSAPTPPSKVSHAAFASHTTGLVRAVMSALLHSVRHRCIVSVTTDGFLSDARDEDIDMTQPIINRFAKLCEMVSPGSAPLEIKGRARQVIGVRTRGQITAICADGSKPILAKTSVSPPPEVPREQHNEYMLKLYLNRVPGQLTLTRPFTSVRDQWKEDADVVREEIPVRLNLEHDFKRQPVDPRMMSVAGTEHIALETRPWRTKELAMRARAIADGWRREHCLKDMKGWAHWDERYELFAARDRRRGRGRAGGLKLGRDGVDGVARRMFLRALRRGECGLPKVERDFSGVARWLTDAGYETDVDDVKNAGRKSAQLVKNALPHSAAVKKFFEVVAARYPDVVIGDFLIDS